jgi:hypothetical protein
MLTGLLPRDGEKINHYLENISAVILHLQAPFIL